MKMLRIVTTSTNWYRLVMVDQYRIDYKIYNRVDKRLPPILRVLNRLNMIYAKDRKKGKQLMAEYPAAYLKPRHVFKRRVNPSKEIPHNHYLLMGINVSDKRKLNVKVIDAGFRRLTMELSELAVTSLTVSVTDLMKHIPLKKLIPIIVEHLSDVLIDVELLVPDDLPKKDLTYIRKAIK